MDVPRCLRIHRWLLPSHDFGYQLRVDVVLLEDQLLEAREGLEGAQETAVIDEVSNVEGWWPFEGRGARPRPSASATAQVWALAEPTKGLLWSRLF